MTVARRDSASRIAPSVRTVCGAALSCLLLAACLVEQGVDQATIEDEPDFDVAVATEALSPSTVLQGESLTGIARLWARKSNGVWGEICSGVMQTNRLMLTAGHCLEDIPALDQYPVPDAVDSPSSFAVLAGRGWSVAELAVVHPSRDLGALRLAYPLELFNGSRWTSSGYMRPITSLNTRQIDDGISVIAAGFGTQQYGPLRVTGLLTTKQTDGRSSPGWFDVFGQTTGEQGDSGGPMLLPSGSVCAACTAVMPVVGILYGRHLRSSQVVDVLPWWISAYGL